MPFTIEVTGPGGDRRAIPIPPGGLTIGRQQGNALVLDDQQVSRHHARIEQQGAAILVTDLDTANGSFLNAERFTGTKPLHPGDTLRLGETTLRLQSTEAATVIGTTPPAWAAPAAGQGPATTPGVAPTPYAGVFPQGGNFSPAGAAPPQPPQGKRPTPLILGVLGGGSVLLLCVCAIIGFTILARAGNSTTASVENPTVTTRSSSAAPVPSSRGGSGGSALPGGSTLPRGSTLPGAGGSGGAGGPGGRPVTGGGGSTAPASSGSATGLPPAVYACFSSDGQVLTGGMYILDDSTYTDLDDQPGIYSYNATTKTITWQSGVNQGYTGYFVDEGETAFGSPATYPVIYNRDKSGSGTPFDNKTPKSAFINCDLFSR